MSEQSSGPVDYLVVELPAARLDGDGLAHLLDLVEHGIIQILDLVVAIVDPDGFTVVELKDLDGDGVLDLAIFDGARSGLLDEEDIAQGASLVAPGNAVGLLLYEHSWARPFVTAMRAAGADVIASGRIPASAVEDALDALDAREGARG